jgi:hypothetical protein
MLVQFAFHLTKTMTREPTFRPEKVPQDRVNNRQRTADAEARQGATNVELIVRLHKVG